MKRIVHIDLDAFFASVETLLNPALQNKPVIVGGGDRGVVSSCNYLARSFGVRSAMSSVEARKRCPQGIFVPGRRGTYGEYSQKVFAIVERFAPVIEKTSIDEAYIDLTGTSLMHRKSYPAIVEELRKQVFEETGLVVSCGLATTKVMAKIGSQLAKPNGFFTVLPDQELATLHSLPIHMLPGVGEVTLQKMQQIGIRRIGEFAGMEDDDVRSLFGRSGLYMHQLAWNSDGREVTGSTGEPQKSISKEETFPYDIAHPQLLEAHMRSLVSSVLGRLRSMEQVTKTIHVKIKFADHSVKQRSLTLALPSQVESHVVPSAMQLLRSLLEPGVAIRQLGFRCSELSTIPIQQSLFGGEVKESRLMHAVDYLKKKFGKSTVQRGVISSLERFSPHTLRSFSVSI